MSRVVVCGVLHPGNSKYFSDFIINLNAQTYESFDLIIINEGVEIDPLNINYKKGNIYVETSTCFDPKQNRDQMFRLLRKRKYDVNVLTDFDDLMSNNRVAESVYSILESKNDICFNDLIPFTNDGEILLSDGYWSERDDFHKQIPNIKHNVFGLGNTAIARVIAELNVEVQNELIYDWEYFLRVSASSSWKISKSRGYTLYRQSNNAIGVNTTTKEKIKDLLEKKIVILEAVADDYPTIKDEIFELKKNKKTIRKQEINYYWFEI